MKSHQFCSKQITDQKAGVELSCHNNIVELYKSLHHFGFYMCMGSHFSNGGKYEFQLLDVLPNPKPYTLLANKDHQIFQEFPPYAVFQHCNLCLTTVHAVPLACHHYALQSA